MSAPLSFEELGSDPSAILQRWIDDARAAGSGEAHAMALATADEERRPGARFVLLRGLDQRGLVFYTSYSSRKARDLASNPYAAVTFYWNVLGRQAIVEGSIERLSDEESDAYFATRPRGHQLSAWASEQSEPVEDRAILEQRLKDYDERFTGDVPRPHSWGGFLLRPRRFEFWQSRLNRLHDRMEFVRSGAGWQRQRLQP